MKSSDFVPHFKIWLSKSSDKSKKKSEYILGGGGAKLLRLIEEERDLGKAAQKLNISYKKAWNILKQMKENTDVDPVISHRGGKGGGGGIKLSPAGKLMLDTYYLYEKIIKDATCKFQNQNQ